MYKKIIRPILFRSLSPEKAHRLTVWLMSKIKQQFLAELISKFTLVNGLPLRRVWKDLEFRNPLGISAGWDKNGEAILGLQSLGIGFLEIGTVTPFNQYPLTENCIHRAIEDEALVNCMGFNNPGVIKVAANLLNTPQVKIPVMASLGKSRTTPIDRAADEYAYLLRALYPYADMFSINISSPNTDKLRDLLKAVYLDDLLAKVVELNYSLADQLEECPKPIVVKISPDATIDQLKQTLDVCNERGIDGLIVANTSTNFKTNLKLQNPPPFSGGISGKPLFKLSLDHVRYTRSQFPDMLIIGSGGVSSIEDAYQMIQAGADLLQIYTAMIYQGPLIFRNINKGLLELLQES